jgi:metalloendopeptidase OMA1, mitochondrial
VSSPSFRIILVVSGGSAVIFYFTHLEEVPVSGRKRFNCTSEATAEEQGLLMYNRIMDQETRMGRILPDWDRRVLMVKRVLARLIEGGELGSGTASGKGGWEVHVIDDPGELWCLPAFIDAVS